MATSSADRRAAASGGPTPRPAINLELLADKVYRLMLAEARLALSRGAPRRRPR